MKGYFGRWKELYEEGELSKDITDVQNGLSSMNKMGKLVDEIERKAEGFARQNSSDSDEELSKYKLKYLNKSHSTPFDTSLKREDTSKTI